MNLDDCLKCEHQADCVMWLKREPVGYVTKITFCEAIKLYDSMEGCCDRAGMDLIRDILGRF